MPIASSGCFRPGGAEAVHQEAGRPRSRCQVRCVAAALPMSSGRRRGCSGFLGGRRGIGCATTLAMAGSVVSRCLFMAYGLSRYVQVPPGARRPTIVYPMASRPSSPVRIRTHRSRGTTKILPSPVSPVRAPLTMALMVGSTKLSLTAISSGPSAGGCPFPLCRGRPR